jgi:hypothetical protein
MMPGRSQIGTGAAWSPLPALPTGRVLGVIGSHWNRRGRCGIVTTPRGGEGAAIAGHEEGLEMGEAGATGDGLRAVVRGGHGDPRRLGCCPPNATCVLACRSGP